MNRLTRLTLTGFRSIRNLDDFEMRSLNVLIGANGAGKSNLISFFRLLGQLVRGELQLAVARQGGATSLLYRGPATTRDIQTHLTFESESRRCEYEAKLTYAANDQLVFAAERYRVSPLEGASTSFVELGAGHRETRLDDLVPEASAIRRLLEGCQVYQFHDTSETARIRQRWPVNDGDALKADGGNLAAVLYRYQTTQPRCYRRIVGTIRMMVPEFTEFHLVPEANHLLLRWRERGTDVIFGPHQASDGTLRIMALVTLLHQPSLTLPEVLLLDEPELGLHPAAITIVAGLIGSVSMLRQVFLATQSIPLLDQFTAEDVVTVNRKAGETIFARPDVERLHEWLEAYSLGELWEKNVLAAGTCP